MIFMNTLRLLIDISFYFSFSSVIVASIFKNHMAMGWMIALVPAFLYVLWVILSKNYILSWHRQIDIFTVFWKIYLGFIFLSCLMGAYQELLTYSVPFGIVVTSTSILFLRMLRHEPEVYLNREFQVKNMLFLGSIFLSAWLFSRKFILFPIKYILHFIYTQVIVPILAFLAVGLGLVVAKVMKGYTKLLAFMKIDSNTMIGATHGANEIENKVLHLAKENLVSSSIWAIIGTVMLAVILVQFFRWLNRTWQKPPVASAEEVLMHASINKISATKEHSSSTVWQVRRQYRKFLKLYQACGQELQICDTSQDISKKGICILDDASILDDMREIYLRARYDNHATKTDIQKMKQMNHILKRKKTRK